MPAKPTPQARVPRSLSVPADLDAAWSAALDASGESRPQWIARHVQEDQAGTVKALREALIEALDTLRHTSQCANGFELPKGPACDCVRSRAIAALAATKEE